MDLLQRELERKKQALAKAKHEAGGSSSSSKDRKKRKYLRQRDLRRLEEEEEEARLQKEQEEAVRQKRIKTSTTTTTPDTISTTAAKKESEQQNDNAKENTKSASDSKKESASKTTTTTAKDSSATSTASIKDITQQLRALGLPIRYFGETHAERLTRLEQAMEQQTHVLQGLSEKEEFALGKGHGIRNTFLDKDEEVDPTNKTSDAKKKKKQQQKEKQEEEDDDDVNGEKDPNKFIYKYFKGLLKEWEHDLADRPEADARTVSGRNDTKTLKQCKDYIRPLFKLLKSRKLEAGMQAQLFKIVTFAKQGEFVRAHDTYMDLAIGRAAWPIGVTMVGIHARSGRAKIESSNVAHVMNSELQRKYLTSVKRLLSFAQKKRPDVDPSKKVG